jgi:hypothetical protein
MAIIIARPPLPVLCIFAIFGGCHLFAAEPVTLWDPGVPLPTKAAAPVLNDVAFHVIKKQRPDVDGCNWTLGVGLVWHKDKLYASYGFNKGDENTASEEAHVRVSEDGGTTWGTPVVIDAGEGNLGVSHGVFLSHGGQLWAFMGGFYDRFQKTHTRAYVLDEATGAWEPRGVVVQDGFWPMQEPQKMADGNWIMAGFRVANGYGVRGHLPAVAISKGEDFTKWDLVVIEAAPNLGDIWGESTIIVEGSRITNISRYGAKALALVATSDDHGRTWTPAQPSNLPMTTSKPYAGRLSSGEPYLICTTTVDSGSKRTPLTIALGRPGESTFSRVLVIRRSEHDGEVESHPGAQLSYPYAIEHDGQLYVGYSNSGGGVGRVGEGRQLWNNNSGELAVIPVAALRAD